MTSTPPPPDTAHETTDELCALADRWRREDFTTHGGAAAHEHADELTALLDAAELVKTVEYRVVYPDTDEVDLFEDEASARHWVDLLGTDADARVEFRNRTVRTWVSGWRPVDTGGAR